MKKKHYDSLLMASAVHRSV